MTRDERVAAHAGHIARVMPKFTTCPKGLEMYCKIILELSDPRVKLVEHANGAFHSGGCVSFCEGEPCIPN